VAPEEPTWSRVQEVLQAALDRPAETRDQFVRDMCRADKILLAEVQSLLVAHERAGNFAEQPALHRLAEGPPASDGLGEHHALLKPGDRLGPYEIRTLIGVGGMGEVYQAIDTRLDRVVAVKVLPRLVDRPDLRERFEREARTVAGLLHPNICVLHDIGAEGSLEYLVMEYVEGETLARRIARGPLSIEDAVRCAIDVARALADIHRHGIVHRDVKPSNIMLTSDGAKLLDFGIAKLHLTTVVASRQEEVGELPAVISSLFGTPQYMAPEQLNGAEVDGRADIFAFGAVLYEMLSGTKAFPSETLPGVTRAILEDAPAPLPTNGSVQLESLARIVERCLAKNPESRWQSADEVLEHLANISSKASLFSALGPQRILLGLLIVGLVGLTILWGSWPINRRSASRAPDASAAARQLTFSGTATSPEISRDGRFVAYWDRGGVFVQDLEQGGTTRVFDREFRLRMFPIRWSPTGMQLLIASFGEAFVVNRSGGIASDVDSEKSLTFPIWWQDDSTIAGISSPERGVGIFARSIKERTAATLRSLCDLPGATAWSFLDWSPARDAFLVVAGSDKAASQILTIDARSCRTNAIPGPDQSLLLARWSADGQAIYYVHRGKAGLWKVRVDPDGKGTSPPTLVRDDHAGPFALSASNRMVYQRQMSSANLWLVAPGGVAPIARSLTEGTSTHDTPALSPDGSRLAFTRQGSVHVVSTSGGPSRQILRSVANASDVTWSTDGRTLAVLTVSAQERGVWIVDADSDSARFLPTTLPASATLLRLQWAPGTDLLVIGAPRPGAMSSINLTTGEGRPIWVGRGTTEWPLVMTAQMSPDRSRAVVSQTRDAGVSYDVYTLPRDGVGARQERSLLPAPLAGAAGDGSVIGWSSDGWIYLRGNSGRDILKVSAAGGRAIPVLRLPENLKNVVDVRMSPQGPPFVVTVRESLSDIWVADRFDR
jgi:serine/threonine protein kinase/Tol biopolymer transport system component